MRVKAERKTGASLMLNNNSKPDSLLGIHPGNSSKGKGCIYGERRHGRQGVLHISGSCDTTILRMLHSISTPSICHVYRWVKTIICSLLTPHKHLPLNCCGGATIVNMVKKRSMSNVKTFLPEQTWKPFSRRAVPWYCFCAQAESEVFWKVTLAANIMACEICSKKSWSYACYPKIAPSSIMLRFGAKLTHAAPGGLPGQWRVECFLNRPKVPGQPHGACSARVWLPTQQSQMKCCIIL